MTEFLIRWPDAQPGGRLNAQGERHMAGCHGVHLHCLDRRPIVLRPLTRHGTPSGVASIDLPPDPETLRDLAGTLAAIAARLEGKRAGVPAVPQEPPR